MDTTRAACLPKPTCHRLAPRLVWRNALAMPAPWSLADLGAAESRRNDNCVSVGRPLSQRAQGRRSLSLNAWHPTLPGLYYLRYGCRSLGGDHVDHLWQLRTCRCIETWRQPDFREGCLRGRQLRLIHVRACLAATELKRREHLLAAARPAAVKAAVTCRTLREPPPSRTSSGRRSPSRKKTPPESTSAAHALTGRFPRPDEGPQGFSTDIEDNHSPDLDSPKESDHGEARDHPWPYRRQ